MEPEFREYQKQIQANARALAATLMAEGYHVVSNGTDTHLMLVDVFSKGLKGREAEDALGRANITVNKNSIPFDTNKPMNPSGIRVGTPAVTTRGMKEPEMRKIGRWIAEVLRNSQDEAAIAQVRRQVIEMAREFPLYRWRVRSGSETREGAMAAR